MPRRRTGFRRIAVQAFLSALLLTAIPVARAVESSSALDEAARLIGSGRSADALGLLDAQQLAWAGHPRFDYLYGVALLDSGRHAEAIDALGRVLAGAPADPAARLELGRALYETGDRAAARRQFEWLLTQGPPPAIRRTAEAYVLAMQPRRDAGGGGWTRSFEFVAGYDTNANASTDDSDFFGIVLDPTNVETSSGFSSLAFYVGHARPLGDGKRLQTGARIGHRWNEAASFVDQTLATVDMVLEFGEGPTIFSLGAGGYYGLLDGESHQWGASGDVGVSRRLGAGWLARGQLRYGILRYDSGFGSLSSLDSDRLTAAATLWRTVDDDGFGFTAIAGRDDPTTSGSPFAADRLGLQFDAVARRASGNGLRFQLAWQEVDFEEDPPFFTVLERADEIWSATVGGEIRDWPARGWHVLPRASYLLNESTISLYEYDRFEFSLTLQRSF